ncbi:Phosphatidylserine synthase [Mycena indigotica]|uniref:CDP-diacylglycerol--serine O-phosphatidyltransferase n=1 Tax=Mycena indigotica TaxID=2126181 RepID=A0A8H6SA52_9AGAR|nr:Phosphatidylserine synthase [Mycena indigotica]KAF7294990.1 Phosphatidylserine synthase [Mycena indigotica]
MSVRHRTSSTDAKADALQQYQDSDGHFSLVRNFRLADLVTIMNGVCGSFSIFSSAHYLINNDVDYLWSALWFPVAGLMFDFFDGKVARWRKSSSLLGQELDSLADLISFGVAPALLAFVVGLRTYLDTVLLTSFICCGLARLARFNATVALVPKDEAGKAKYFEGLPIPSSLALVGVLAFWTWNGWIEGQQGLPLGTCTLWGAAGGRGEVHLVSFVFGAWAAAMAKDVRRVFLQSVLSRGNSVLSDALCQTLWGKSKEIVQTVNPNVELPDEEWLDFVANLNKSLDPLQLELKSTQDEITGRLVYSMVNCKEDGVSQLATAYTPIEIAYFKAVVEQIMLAPRESYSISSLAALREVSALKPKSNMSKTQAEVVLSSFVANGWLLRSKRGRYSLSSRSLLELALYLKSTYPDELHECTFCSGVVTKGYACKAPNCDCHIHTQCFTKLIQRSRHCPACSKGWPNKGDEMTPIGEAAVRDGEDGKRRVRRAAENSDEDDDDDDEDEEDQIDTSSRKPDQSMDVDEEDSDTPVKKTRGSRRK